MYSNHYFGKYAEDIEKLDFHRKLMLGVLVLRDLSSCVAHFDGIYNEKLLPFYENMINALKLASASGLPASSLCHLRDACIRRVPDTDTFPAKEGTFAQYAMISACYLLAFALEYNVGDFYRSLDFYIENLCAQNQCAEEPLSDAMLNEYITAIWASLIASLEQEVHITSAADGMK